MAGIIRLLAGWGFGRLSKSKTNKNKLGLSTQHYGGQFKVYAVLDSNYKKYGQGNLFSPALGRKNHPFSKPIYEACKTYFIECSRDSVMRPMLEATNRRRNAFQLWRFKILGRNPGDRRRLIPRRNQKTCSHAPAWERQSELGLHSHIQL